MNKRQQELLAEHERKTADALKAVQLGRMGSDEWENLLRGLRDEAREAGIKSRITEHRGREKKFKLAERQARKGEFNIAMIRVDGGTQLRAEANEETIEQYRVALVEWDATFPPVVVFFDGAAYWLADGFQRYEAFKRAGRTTIPTEIRRGSRRDALLYSAGANATHGLPRTNADKRRAVEALLSDAEWSQWADREIARRCNVSAPFVATVRGQVGAALLDVKTDVTVNGLQLAAPQPSAEARPEPEKPRPRKTIRKGKVVKMDTAKIGTSKATPARPAAPESNLFSSLSEEHLASPAEEESPVEKNGRMPVGVVRANEAINCLIRIPKNDALRKRGFQIVTDWIRRNK